MTVEKCIWYIRHWKKKRNKIYLFFPAVCLIASAHLPGFLPFDFTPPPPGPSVCLAGLVCVFAVFTSVLTGTTRLSPPTHKILWSFIMDEPLWFLLLLRPPTIFVFLPSEKLSCVRIHPDASIHTQITEKIFPCPATIKPGCPLFFLFLPPSYRSASYPSFRIGGRSIHPWC